MFRQPLATRGCPTSGMHLDMPWEDFKKAVQSAITQRYLVSETPKATKPQYRSEPAITR